MELIPHCKRTLLGTDLTRIVREGSNKWYGFVTGRRDVYRMRYRLRI